MYDEKYHKKVHGHRIMIEETYLCESIRSKKLYFSNISENVNVLDYGGGLGQNVYLLNNAVVFDISDFALSFCKEKGISTVDDINKINDGSMDVVICSHVLEHVENPYKVLNTIYKKLKSGGKLILILPFEQNGASSFEPDVNQHLFSWNFRNINNLLMRVGFKIKENKFLYFNMGKIKLSFLGKINMDLYYYITAILGKIFRKKELYILVEK